MPEQAINTAKDEPVVSVPSEGDSVDINLQEEKQEETKDNSQLEVVTQEGQGEELEEYSDKVKTRINKLTGKLREAERREQASFQYAKRVADENKKLKAKSNSLDASYIQEFEARTQIETKKAEQDLQTAIQAGDASAQVEAQKALAKLSIDNERLLATKEAKESLKEEQKEDVTPEQLREAPPKKVDPKAEAWAEKNPWFGKDEAMTYASFGIHKKLVEEDGFNPNSDEYYAEIDKRIKTEFPHKFGANSSESTRPVQPVASAGRSTTQSTSGRKTVRLSPSQVHIAKRLGVPLEEYAKYVKE
jgi:F0F1-type ATP synthase membrane subunit b/b'